MCGARGFDFAGVLPGTEQSKDGKGPMIRSDEYRNEYTKDFVSHWDQLIGWEGREKGEGGFFKRLLTAHDVETVIDVASGTGFHSVILARDGFTVTAADGSANMLARTENNAEQHGVEFEDTGVVDWLQLKEEFGTNQFDALVCLGNAFTHLFDHELRRQALASMFAILKPGGLICVDHRNYDRMLNHGYSSKHKYYYTGHGVDARPVKLNVTLAHFEYTFPDGEKYHLKLYPLKQGYMTHLLEDAGFVDIMTYGDFERPYVEDDVDFIQQVAFKPRHSRSTNGGGNGRV